MVLKYGRKYLKLVFEYLLSINVLLFLQFSCFRFSDFVPLPMKPISNVNVTMGKAEIIKKLCTKKKLDLLPILANG